jgi:hypothetical protein
VSYEKGGAWGMCPRCGFDKRLRTFRQEWNGLRVCPECYDPKHPQLSVRGKADDQSLPFASPEPAETYLDPGGDRSALI